MRHTVHLKTLSPFGQRTNEPHVIQFPVAKSFVPTSAGFSRLRLSILSTSSMESDSSTSAALSVCFFFFFLRAKRDANGNGWLMERPCRGLCGRKSESEELNFSASPAASVARGVLRLEVWFRASRSGLSGANEIPRAGHGGVIFEGEQEDLWLLPVWADGSGPDKPLPSGLRQSPLGATKCDFGLDAESGKPGTPHTEFQRY